MKKIFCVFLLIMVISGFTFPQSANWVKILDGTSVCDLKYTSNGYLITSFQFKSGIYMSSDSGTTWAANPNIGDYINKILVDKNDVIYLAFPGSAWSIHKSTDLGVTWSISHTPYFAVNSLYSGNNGYIYAGGDSGRIIRSTDAGISWSKFNVTNTITSITSLISTKNDQIFACTQNGKLFTSTDYGENWTQLTALIHSLKSIIADSNDYLYIDQNQNVGVSTDYGLTWNLYGNFPSYIFSPVSGLDYLSNVYISFGSIFRSNDQGKSWFNMGAPEEVTNIVPYHDKIYIAAYNGVYKYDPTIPVYVGNNYFPLHVGNTYQYFETVTNDYITYYNFYTTTINKDTVINNKTYYNYSGWTRYSEEDKKIYKFVNDNDRVYMDFNKAVGDTFYQYLYNDTNCVTVIGGAKTIFSQKYNYKGFSRVNNGYPKNSQEKYFAENIGIFLSEYQSSGEETSYEEDPIIMAILYDSLGNKHYYSNHRKPQITITPITAIHSNSFSLNFDINHYYNQTSGNPTEGSLNFIDSVVFMSYYQKGDSLITKPDLLVSNPSVGKYQMATTLDTVLMKKGFVFNYRIIAKDKGIIQETASSPDAGYYKCVWDFGQGIENKNNIPAEYMLAQNYPNPFNPNTIISYGLKEKGYVRLMVYNITGELVQELVNERREQGNYEIEFNAKGLASGIYLYRLEVIDKGNIPVYSSMKKMVFLK